MSGYLTNLDNGSPLQWVNTWLGYSLGWVKLPVAPELLVESAGPLVLPNFVSRVLLMVGSVTPITLPGVSQWMQATGAGSLVQNVGAFDRSIWCKDYSYSASALTPIVILPSGADLIDGQPSFSIVEAGATICCYPLTDLSGWFVG